MKLLKYEFNTLEELYKRVRPALHSKKQELTKFGYTNINEIDIWNCLKEKWKNSINLTLFDIVDDILGISCDDINSYYKKISHNIKKDIEV